jgi:diguanylate cyclase (GGDEF)-like protein/PAS domain S-box-containing protein
LKTSLFVDFQRRNRDFPLPRDLEVGRLSADGYSSIIPINMPAFQDPEMYRDILDELQIGVSVLDLQKKIVFWSDGAEQLTGYARIDVLGHSCSQNILLHCNYNTCETCAGKCPMATALHDAKPVEATSSIHHKYGYWVPVHTWAIPLRDKHGSIVGIIQTFEAEFTLNGPSPNDRSMKERGWLDDVTGLPSPTMMQARLHEMLRTLEALQVPFGVVCVEVQELTQFRARYGQEAARSMLEVLARTLRNTVWPTDFVGRWSEARFLVILSGCAEEALQAVAGRLLQMMASVTIKWWGEELSVAVSIGQTGAVAGDTIESILQRVQHVLKEDPVGVPVHAAGADTRSSRSGTD